MNLIESLMFLREKGLPVTDFIEINERKDMEKAEELGFPLVMKITEGHKTEVQGVILNINSKTDLEKALVKLSRLGKPIVVQKQVSGIEVIIGIKKDEIFGHVIMFGLGGIFVEVMKDVSFRLCPISKKDALGMIDDLRAKELLFGVRGKKETDIDNLAELLVKISKIDLSYIEEMDLNPVILDGKDFFIVDSRIIPTDNR